MSKLQVEWRWQEASQPIDMDELAQACNISSSELSELLEYGALTTWVSAPKPLFNPECIAPLRIACRLRQTYDLDLFAVSLVMDYLQRIEQLENQVRSLQAQLISE